MGLVNFFDGLLDGFTDSEISREEIDFDKVVFLIAEPDRVLILDRNLVEKTHGGRNELFLRGVHGKK